MQSKKNKRNLNRQRKCMQPNGLFGIKHIRKIFRVKMKNGEDRNIEAGVWTIYEKSSGNQLATGKFSQMIDVLGNVAFINPEKVIASVEGEEKVTGALEEINEENIEKIEIEKEEEIKQIEEEAKQ